MKKRVLYLILPVLLIALLAGLAGIVFSEGEKTAGDKPTVTLPVLAGTGKVFDDTSTDLIQKYTGTVLFTDTCPDDGQTYFEYVQGENGTTAPTEGWNKGVPGGWGVGTYHIWYRLVTAEYSEIAIKATYLGSYTITRADYIGYESALTVDISKSANTTKMITLPDIDRGAKYGSIVNANTDKFTFGEIIREIDQGRVILTTGENGAGNSALIFTVPVVPDDNHNGYDIIVTVTPRDTAGTVAQVGSVKYNSLQAALDAVSEGTEGAPSTVTLLGNTSEDIEIYKDYVTIDLNGKTLEGKGEVVRKVAANSQSERARPAVTVLPEAQGVTLKNGTVSMDADYKDYRVVGILSRGSMTADGLTITVRNKQRAGAEAYGIFSADNTNETNGTETIRVINCDICLNAASNCVGISAGVYPDGAFKPGEVYLEACKISFDGSTPGCRGTLFYTSAFTNTITGINEFDLADGLNFYDGVYVRSSSDEDILLDISGASGDMGTLITRTSIGGTFYVKGAVGDLFSEKYLSCICNNTWFTDSPEGFRLWGGGGELFYTSDPVYGYVIKQGAMELEGSDGKIAWCLHLDGELTVYTSWNTSVPMPEFSTGSPAPWAAYSDEVTKIVVKGNVGSISAGAFSGLTKVQSVHIEKALTPVASDAFSGCIALRDIYLGFSEEAAWATALSAEKHYSVPLEASLVIEAIKEVQALGTVTYNDACWEAISDARTKYDALSEAIAAAVPEASVNALTAAEAAFKTAEEGQPAYEVVVYSGDVDGMTSVAVLDGGGLYHTVTGGDVTSHVDVGKLEGYDFLGWYQVSDTGEILKFMAKPNERYGNTVLHVNPTENMILAALYAPVVTKGSYVSVKAKAGFTLSPEPEKWEYYDSASGNTYQEGEIEESAVTDAFEKRYYYNYGTEVTISSSNKDFKYWKDDNVQVLCREKDYTFKFICTVKLFESTELNDAKVVFLSKDKKTTLFVLYYNKSDSTFKLPDGYTWDQFDMTAAEVQAAIGTTWTIEVHLK